MRHDDGARHAVLAGGPGDALAVVAARGADDFARQRILLRKLLEERQPAANLEGSDRVVVLMLEPAVRAQPLGQQRPAVLRRGLEFGMHSACGGFDVLQVREQIVGGAGRGHGVHAAVLAFKVTGPRGVSNVARSAGDVEDVLVMDAPPSCAACSALVSRAACG
ncbi:hypothetical protein SDC9_72790 [bioreactor metagenome]|uniref:Uncharacterized protein n=1 Tax=bioreactor metagenome TaxID=1076179 RepID=A0A644YDC1_9ZZZZ